MIGRRRYTVRANPRLRGETVPVSFRCPREVVAKLDELVAAQRPGIDNRTDALQDALVVWELLEEGDMAAEAAT